MQRGDRTSRLSAPGSRDCRRSVAAGAAFRRTRRLALGLFVVLAAAAPIGATRSAHAQAALAPPGATAAGVARPADDKDKLPPWLKKMAGSSVDLLSYVGSGSFYASGFRDEYVAAAVFVRPTYDLGTRFKLSVNARLFAEQELTLPGNPTGRRFNPYDVWLWLSAKELHMFQRSQIRMGGVVRVVLPTSYESRYSHMLSGVALGPNFSRKLEFGSAGADGKRWGLNLTLGTVFTKYLYTSQLRGDSPGDSSGCRRFGTASVVGGGGGGIPSGAASDHCGGPVNTNFTFMTSGSAAVTRGKWSFSSSLLIINAFHYRVPVDESAGIYATDIGQVDSTWGILTLSYSITDHLGVSVGLSSYQPALDARYRYPRFPFFDLSGGANANNFTQAFLGLSGTL
jgi:hypothetical protein